jgi:hypothetical protein
MRLLGQITVFKFLLDPAVKPLSPHSLAEDKTIYYEDNNKTHKVVKGDQHSH